MRVGQLHVLGDGDARRPVRHVLELRVQPIPHGAVARRDRVAVVPRRERAQELFGAPVEKLALVHDVAILHVLVICLELALLALETPFPIVFLIRTRRPRHVLVVLLLLLLFALRNLRALGLFPRRNQLAHDRARLLAELLEHLALLDDGGTLFERAHVILARAGLGHRRHHAIALAHLGVVKGKDRVGRLADRLGRRLVNAGAHVFEPVDQTRVVCGVRLAVVPVFKPLGVQLQQLLPGGLDAGNRPRQRHVVGVEHGRVRLKPEGRLARAKRRDLKVAVLVLGKVRRHLALLVAHVERRRVKVHEAGLERLNALRVKHILRRQKRVPAVILDALERVVERALWNVTQAERHIPLELVRLAAVGREQVEQVVQVHDA